MLKRFFCIAPAAALMTVGLFATMQQSLQSNLTLMTLAPNVNTITLLTEEEARRLLPERPGCGWHVPREDRPPSAHEILAMLDGPAKPVIQKQSLGPVAFDPVEFPNLR